MGSGSGCGAGSCGRGLGLFSTKSYGITRKNIGPISAVDQSQGRSLLPASYQRQGGVNCRGKVYCVDITNWNPCVDCGGVNCVAGGFTVRVARVY